jgi:hypothetical protein
MRINLSLPAGFEGPQAPYVHAYGPQAPHPRRGSGKKRNLVTNLPEVQCRAMN